MPSSCLPLFLDSLCEVFFFFLLLWRCQVLWMDTSPCGGERPETSLYLSFICQEPAVSKSFPPTLAAILALSCHPPPPLAVCVCRRSFLHPPLFPSHTHPSPLGRGCKLSLLSRLPPSLPTGWTHTPYVVCMQTNAAGHICRPVVGLQHNLKMLLPACVCETPSVRLT